MNFNPINELDKQFWEGKHNLFVRLLTYAKVSANQLNDYKYIGAIILGIYLTLKLSNPLWLVGMCLVVLPLMILHGRWWLYRGAKSSEFIMTQKGTVIGYDQFNASLKTIELLEEIKGLLKK